MTVGIIKSGFSKMYAGIRALLDNVRRCVLCKRVFIQSEMYTTKRHKASGLCEGCFSKPFEVVHVTRELLLSLCSGEELASLDDKDMSRIASRVFAMYGGDSDAFWFDLESVVDDMLREKKGTIEDQ